MEMRLRLNIGYVILSDPRASLCCRFEIYVFVYYILESIAHD